MSVCRKMKRANFIILTIFIGSFFVTCSDQEDFNLGRIAVCVDSEYTQPLPGYMNTTFHIEGTVKDISSPNDKCPNSDHVFLIEDEAGKPWTFGISVEDDEGKDVAPILDVKVGQSVEAFVKIRSVWDISYAVSILDEFGLAAAWANGGTLESDQTDGMSVGISEINIATDMDDCGTKLAKALYFENVSEVLVENGETALLDMGNYSVNVKNIGTWVYGDDYHCEDAGGVVGWMAWR